MRAVVQRVTEAQVTVGKRVSGKIGRGAVILLGVARDDSPDDAVYLVRKISQLRMFADENGKMNVAAKDVGAGFLVISQFTLYGNCRKGRRPSFDQAAPPEEGERLYALFAEQLRQEGFQVETGEFGAMMDVDLVNNGPVTFILESER
ncbi:MAG: D-aminoacyl-tRNA deacylase [Candidatus Omnitrophota bacterium]